MAKKYDNATKRFARVKRAYIDANSAVRWKLHELQVAGYTLDDPEYAITLDTYESLLVVTCNLSYVRGQVYAGVPAEEYVKPLRLPKWYSRD